MGPPAVEKLKAFFNVSDDPAPDKIKLDFQHSGGASKMVVWRPKGEYLHEVFEKSGRNIQDFSISYVDNDGDELELQYSKEHIDDMFRSIKQPARLTILWQAPTAREQARQFASSVGGKAADKYHHMRHWITGGGTVKEKDVTDLQATVEKQGGRIVPDMSGVSLIDHRDYDAKSWGTAVDLLKNELRLTDDEAAGLKAAQYRGEGKGMHFQDVVEKGVRRTRYVAYRTVREGGDNGKIHIIYGRHELSMEVLGPGESYPMENCIQFGARVFTVLPPACPHSCGVGSDMTDRPFDIPSGWKIVDVSDDDFEGIARDVIGRYYWHTDRIVAHDNGKWPSWRTAMRFRAGSRDYENFSGFTCDAGQQRCQFTASSARVLIERAQHTSFALLKDWKRYVQLDAQREWSGRLGLAPPKDEL